MGEYSFKSFAKSGQPERGDRCTVHESSLGTLGTDLGLAHFELPPTASSIIWFGILVGTMVDIARWQETVCWTFARLLEEPESDLLNFPPRAPDRPVSSSRHLSDAASCTGPEALHPPIFN